jgi:hypothetical protein
MATPLSDRTWLKDRALHYQSDGGFALLVAAEASVQEVVHPTVIALPRAEP